MIRQRLRITFTKQDDLRWLSHRDLMRTWERLLRRAAVPLSMSEGFHPKPRMNFPSALAVGIAGLNEVLEVDLSELWTADQLEAALATQLPPGLVLRSVMLMPLAAGKAQAIGVDFAATVPPERQAVVAERIAWLLGQATYPIEREGRAAPLDVRPLIEQLEINDGVLHMRLRVDRQGSARPREVLAAIGLDDLEAQGGELTRTHVVIE